MIATTIGWAEQFGKALADQDEQRKCDVTGLKPRNCFRVSAARRYASARKGGQKGANTRARNARLKP